VETLLWGNDEHIQNIKNDYENFDFIVGSDLLYEPLNYPNLLKTILKLSVSETVTILAHPVRHLGEKQFLHEASQFFNVSSLKLEPKNTHIFELRLRGE
jgi:hypothetical protein